MPNRKKRVWFVLIWMECIIFGSSRRSSSFNSCTQRSGFHLIGRKLGVWQFGFFVVGQNRITPTNWIETKRLLRALATYYKTCPTVKFLQQMGGLFLYTSTISFATSFWGSLWCCCRCCCCFYLCCVWLLLLLMLLLLLLLLFVLWWCCEQFYFSCCLLMGKGTQQTKLSKIQLSRYCWFGLIWPRV